MGGRQIVVAVLMGAGLTAATGCGGGGAGGGGSSAQPAAASSADPSAPNGVESLAPREIVDKSVQALKESHSVHVAGQVSSAGSAVTIDLAMDGDAHCAGSMSLDGEGGFGVVQLGEQLWIKPDQTFLETHGGPAIAALVGDKYLRTTTANTDFADVGSLCDLNTIADLIGTDNGPLGQGSRTTVDGTPVVTVQTTQGDSPGTLYVAVQGRPYPVRLETNGGSEGGRLDFKDFGAQVAATAPPADRTLDLDELQRESGATGAASPV
ncbi:hypothetical protein AB0D08_08660 [Kitasatospora sp. NPDC048540]|uniref:hypothetical protein n=1 Tax=unclassified Kitasatospora TaxID=2633591 RepID=UPI00053A064C|nr:hypothetical protein [Kitasatospora sp. MBT63]